MAFISDSNLLLDHIKNCFIYGDDTGICETIINHELPDDFNLEKAITEGYDLFEFDKYNNRRSPDIPFESTEYISRKTSAEVRIKEVENQKLFIPQDHYIIDAGNLPKILTEEEIDDLFEIKEYVKPIPKKGKSLLSKMLEMDKHDNNDYMNAFLDYFKFSAVKYNREEDESGFLKLIDIPLCNNDESNDKLKEFVVYICFNKQSPSLLNDRPVKVVPIEETKVSEFIGLVCWKYTEENRFPPINREQISNFQLQMYEDIDDINLNFGQFLETDPIYKYNFDKLALTEISDTTDARKCSTTSSIMSVDSSFVTQSHKDRMGFNDEQDKSHKVMHENYRRRDRIVEEPEEEVKPNSELISVEIHFSHDISYGEFSSSMTLKELINTMETRNLLSNYSSDNYKLTLLQNPSIELNMDLKLIDLNDWKFALTRKDISRGEDHKEKNGTFNEIRNSDESVSSTLFNKEHLKEKTYSIIVKSKFRNFQAKMIVDGNSIIIDPQIDSINTTSGSNSKKLLKQPKPIYIFFNQLADCLLVKSNQSKQKMIMKLLFVKSKRAPTSSNTTSQSSFIYSLSSIHGSDENISSPPLSNLTHSNSTPISSKQKSSFMKQLSGCIIKCHMDIGKVIHEQIMGILNLKMTLTRKQYLFIK